MLNKKLHRGKNPDSIYLAGFTEAQIDHLKEQALAVISETKRLPLVLNCAGRTWRDAVTEATGTSFKTNAEAFRYIEKQQKNTNAILIVAALSRCKVRTPSGYARRLIKNIDDAHFKSVYPESDLVFVDYASFLEKNWSYIGPYLRVNTLIHSFHFYPQLAEQPLRSVK